MMYDIDTLPEWIRIAILDATGADLPAKRNYTGLEEFVARHAKDFQPATLAKLMVSGPRFAEIAQGLWDEKDFHDFWRNEYGDVGTGTFDNDAFMAYADLMPTAHFAMMMLKYPVVITKLAEAEDPGNPINKRAALDVAEILGPDWAQAWYRFIVLVTKLA